MKKYLDNILITIFVITYILLVIYVIKDNNNYDVNRDGKVNAQDYTEIKNYIMNRED